MGVHYIRKVSDRKVSPYLVSKLIILASLSSITKLPFCSSLYQVLILILYGFFLVLFFVSGFLWSYENRKKKDEKKIGILGYLCYNFLNIFVVFLLIEVWFGVLLLGIFWGVLRNCFFGSFIVNFHYKWNGLFEMFVNSQIFVLEVFVK